MLSKERFGREPHGHENLEVICKLFTDELNGLKKPTAVASSSMSDESNLQVHDVLASTPMQVALLQNPSLKVGQMHLGLIENSIEFYESCFQFLSHTNQC